MVPTAAVDLGASLQQALDRFIGFLPNLLAFLVILFIGYLIARLVRSAVIAALRIPALTGFLNDVQGYLPNVVAAVLIFVAAAALAGLLGGVVRDLMGDTQMGRLLQAVVPGLILAIGTFMVLDQLNIAPQIVTITYAALLGMLALAGALAFGLGGRDVASRMLEDAYEAGRRGRDSRRDEARVARTQPPASAPGRLGGAETTPPARP